MLTQLALRWHSRRGAYRLLTKGGGGCGDYRVANEDHDPPGPKSMTAKTLPRIG